MATLMHRSNRVIDLVSHARLLDGTAVLDDSTSFFPNSGFNPMEIQPSRSRIPNIGHVRRLNTTDDNLFQPIMDGGVMVWAHASPGHHIEGRESSIHGSRETRRTSSRSIPDNIQSRTFHSQQEVRVPYASQRSGNRTGLRILPSEGVAVLEMSGGLQLEVQDASYEQLLALGDRIGNVSTGLSEQTIASKLKMRTYSLSSKCINLEVDVCIICQDNYKSQEILGRLSCNHEFHADCLTKWLVLKNECPMCRSTGLIVD